MLNAAIVLFVFFSLLLAVLVFRMMKRTLSVIKQKWEATAAYVPPQRPTPPPLEIAGTPRRSINCGTPYRQRDDDFENAMMGTNVAGQVGNVFPEFGPRGGHGNIDD